MKFYTQFILCFAISSLSLFASKDHSSEIKTLEAQALQKLTQQLRSNTPVNISSELTTLHQIALAQAEEKKESLQKATTIFGAAAIGALLAKATTNQSRPSVQHISYRSAPTTAEAEATKMVTGLEATAIAAFLPSGSSIFYGALAVGTLFALYEFNKGLHAPCRAKFQLAEHHFDNQLQAMRSDIDHKQEELRNTLAALQTENARLAHSLLNTQKGIQGVKANQTRIQSEIGAAATALSSIRSNLSTMSKKAHWDVSRFPQRVADAHAAQEGLTEQQEALRQKQELQEIIRKTEIDVLVDELESRNESKGAGVGTIPTGPQRSAKRLQHPKNVGAGVFPTRIPVEEVGNFGCCGYSNPQIKKPTELR